MWSGSKDDQTSWVLPFPQSYPTYQMIPA
jgi:hypothetical protein